MWVELALELGRHPGNLRNLWSKYIKAHQTAWTDEEKQKAKGATSVMEIHKRLPDKPIEDIWAFRKHQRKEEAQPEKREARRAKGKRWQRDIIFEDIVRVRKLEVDEAVTEEHRNLYSDMRRRMELELHWLDGTRSTALEREIDEVERHLPEGSPRAPFYIRLRECMQGDDKALRIPDMEQEQLWEVHTRLRSIYAA
jgi:hypothetical protein